MLSSYQSPDLAEPNAQNKSLLRIKHTPRNHIRREVRTTSASGTDNAEESSHSRDWFETHTSLKSSSSLLSAPCVCAVLLHTIVVGRVVHEHQYVMMTHRERHRASCWTNVKMISIMSNSGAACTGLTDAPPALSPVTDRGVSATTTQATLRSDGDAATMGRQTQQRTHSYGA